MSEQLVDEPAEAGDIDETRTERTPWQALLWAQRVSWLGAMACALVLELSGLIGEQRVFWESTFVNGLGYVADSLVIWLFLVALIGLTNRVTLSLGIVVAFTVVIAVANRVKLGLRSEPIYPSDVDFLSQPEFLKTMVAPHILVIAGFGLGLMVLAAWFLGRKFEPRMLAIWPEHLSVRRQLVAVLTRAVIITLALMLLVDTTRFNNPGNPFRAIYEVGDGQRWRYWDQKENYATNGFVGGFLYNMPTVAMETPAGYDEATMDALATRYERVAAKVNRDRTGSLDDVNVVMVLSESFSDPTRLKGFQLAQDPIPKTRQMMAQGTSGNMMAQLLGGGTANMEFEMLTGQSIGLFAPQLSSPYQMLVPEYDTYPSAVGYFASHGHKPIAVHPYITSFYKRDQVYKIFGFQDFIHDTTMAEQDRIDDSEFISDKSAFDEVQRQIEASDQPLAVNLVTMQNHIPVDSYHDPIPVTGVEGEEANRIGNYARGLAHTDDALAEFLQGLKDSGEKTVVVFYGDHLPGIYGTDVIDQNPGNGMYTTPFFLWSSEGTPKKVLPQSSPTQFLPMLYDLADAPLPPYYALLDRLRTHVAALEQGRMLDPEGRMITEADLDRQGKRLLNDARLVQYDFSIGQRYSLDRMWPGSLNQSE